MRIALLLMVACAGQSAQEVVLAGISVDAQNADAQAREQFGQFIAAAVQYLDMQVQAADQPPLTAAEHAAVVANAQRVSMGRAEHTAQGDHWTVRYRVARSQLESAFVQGIASRQSAKAIVGATFDGLRPESPAPESPAARPPAESSR